MNGDGVPEFFISNGYTSESEKATYVYTFYFSYVQRVGTIQGDVYVNDDTSQPGVYAKSSEGWTRYTKAKYFEMRHEVLTREPEGLKKLISEGEQPNRWY